MTTSSTALGSRAEAAIRRLPYVEGVSVRTEGEDIREIHVATSDGRPAKNIVRDVQTMLRTAIGVTIDHRVVSVAMTGPGKAPPAPQAPQPERAAAPAAAAAVAPEAPASPRIAADDRIRFESVNLFVSGPRTQAQVELRWMGLPRIGSASGWSTRDESHRLVAQAAAAAAQEFLADPVAFNVQGVDFVDLGPRRIVVVAVSMLAHRQEKILSGSCMVDQDTPQAVVLATLAALNRVIGGMRVKEPTEYVLRPLSN